MDHTSPTSVPAHPRTPTLGANFVGAGTHFALYSGTAQAIDLCLFDTSDGPQSMRIPMQVGVDQIWRAHVLGVGPGQHYGYRVHGPYVPNEGLRCNAAKLLLDPYARAFSGFVPADDALLGHNPAHPIEPDFRDSAPIMPKCVVKEDRWGAGEDRHPEIQWDQTVIYECHVKGLTRLHPGVEPAQRGTYLGLASPPIINHLKNLGITTVELLPVQYFVNERRLVHSGLVNYWGYNTIGFFAPDPRYATSPDRAIEEFQMMVASLHRAGIEVILDVVYNHTAEGDELGPTLSFRGIDNACYYQLEPPDPARYANHSACGNTLNTLQPIVQRLIMDSLRYWVEVMHVDGFRFDLATALCREPAGVDPYFRFFSAILQDPVLGRCKLILEPWDAGPGGMRLGKFPSGTVEWNGRYRDCVRRFWRGDDGLIAEFASRLAGSSDSFAAKRTPMAGVNYVTCHDGSTLYDLVSYANKHNEANAEDNRDGPADNFAAHYGMEGPTDNAQIRSIRERMMRNFIATLAFSQGVPMLTAGDEFARSQRGNDNAYCQDNETSWLHWDFSEDQTALIDFVRQALSIRREHPALRRSRFFNGRNQVGQHDVQWLDEDGRELTVEQWHDPHRRCLAMLIRDSIETTPGDQKFTGAPARPDPNQWLLILINARKDPVAFRLPSPLSWRKLIYTGEPCTNEPRLETATLEGRTMMLLEAS